MTADVTATVPRKKKWDKENFAGTLMASIPLIGFAIFGLLPMLAAIAMSFLQINGMSFEGAKFIGLQNYAKVLSNPDFGQSFVNTLYMALSVPISLVISLVVAMLLNANIKGRKVFSTVFFIPYVCSVVAIALMWSWIFNTQYGVLNQWLGRTGENAIDWMGDPNTFIPAVIIMSVWSGTGFGIILFSAALTNVNSTLVEAARVDGAGPLRIQLSIVFPAISPTTFYILLMGLIGALQAFAMTNVLASEGGPDGKGITVVFFLYKHVFNYANAMGQAAAIAWMLALVILAFTVINFVLSKLWVNYD